MLVVMFFNPSRNVCALSRLASSKERTDDSDDDDERRD